MKNEQTLDVGDGIERDIEFINSPMSENGRIIIEMHDDRNLSQIAADFEGREKLIRKDNLRKDIETVYTGFTNLVSIQRNGFSGTVRIILSKS